VAILFFFSIGDHPLAVLFPSPARGERLSLTERNFLPPPESRPLEESSPRPIFLSCSQHQRLSPYLPFPVRRLFFSRYYWSGSPFEPRRFPFLFFLLCFAVSFFSTSMLYLDVSPEIDQRGLPGPSPSPSGRFPAWSLFGGEGNDSSERSFLS